MRTMHFRVPGFKYLGPGNKLPVEPLFIADAIALEHDKTYSMPNVSSEQITRSDIRAVVLLTWVSVWSAISSVCLLVKVVAERLFGTTFYPFALFSTMDFLMSLLLIVALLWLSILEMRLQGLQHNKPANACVQSDTMKSVRCLLQHVF